MPDWTPDDTARLARALRVLSPTTDLLHELVGIGHFDEVAMTRDDILIARPRRCAGFDAFIGKPTAAQMKRCAELYRELEPAMRRLVIERLLAQQIDPLRVGIVVDEANRCSMNAAG
jgi:hypothetical protein